MKKLLRACTCASRFPWGIKWSPYAALSLQDRWVAVDVTMNSLRGLPPVELYKIGEAYFVVDGNHRVSVARANGNKDIEAVVTEWETRLPFTLEDFAEDKWMLKAAYSDFIQETKSDQLRPDAKLEVSNSDHYQTLLRHIAVHRYLSNNVQHYSAIEQEMGQEGHGLSWSEAVASWYGTVYRPIVEAIRTHNLYARFPKHTEVDLDIVITHYREQVAAHYALAPLGAEIAVRIFAANHSERTVGRLWLMRRQRVRARLPLGWGQMRMPAGMTAEEFDALRLRREAGELSLGEAGQRAAQQFCFSNALCECALRAHPTG
jgi:hypothetical protein